MNGLTTQSPRGEGRPFIPPAKPGALRLLAPQRGLIAIGKESNPPSSPFVKRGKSFPSLWKREVGRDFIRRFQTAKLIRKA
jgi:hypothetical protein